MTTQTLTRSISTTRWLVDAGDDRTGPPLVIFPHAGAGPSAYRRLGRAVAGAFRPLVVHLPGRETRLDDEPYRDLPTLVRALCPAVVPLLSSRFAFYGHSMGALVAFELARLLRRTYGVEPDHLVVSGHAAPRGTWPPKRHRLCDQELWASVCGMLGTPPEVAGDPQMRAMLLPTFRADFEVCETYRYRPERPLECPITSFAGEHDDEAPPAGMTDWGAETRAAYRHQTLPGNHFFNLSDHYPTQLLHALT